MSMLNELIELERAYCEEIIAARENSVPEDAPCMVSLLQIEQKFRQEVAELERKAADIVRRYQL